MFFIAFFGIQDKDKYIGSTNNVTCPECGELAGCEIHKQNRYFHVFFIPVYRWNVRYIAKTSCCGCAYELDRTVGREFEKNPDTEIKKENLRRPESCLPFKFCANCRVDVPAEFKYCPYCGIKL
ncbi:MAG TPA: zinc ribbon domain-containing protein [Clostridiales bacterium]|jgi:hypothetical protein|nr:zinc ribbon domain-containing protein [Clostridiales bacterium]